MKPYDHDTRAETENQTHTWLKGTSAAGLVSPASTATPESPPPDREPLVLNAMKLAAAKERQRILLQLHDHVIQNLALAKMKLETALQKEADQALVEITDLPAVLERAVHAMRHLEFYSPPPLLREHGLCAALNGVGETLGQEHGFSFSLKGEEPPVPEDLKLTLYQMTRELLINTVKHAHASNVTVTLSEEAGATAITVSDDGMGFDPGAVPEGMGLSGIEKQLRLLEGELRVETAAGKGTTIRMQIPPLEITSHTVRKCRTGLSIVLADDHRMLREGLKAVLEQEGDLSVVAEADNGDAAVGLACRLQPHVVIMDLTMPGIPALEAVRAIRTRKPEVEVVVLTVHDDRQNVLEAVRAGAKGFVVKNRAGSELIEAVRAVARKETFLSPSVSGLLVQELLERGSRSRGAATLSAREQQVLLRLAQGNCTKEIAYQLGVNSKTVETYRQNLMKKLQLNNVADLTRYAIKQGMLELK